MSVPVLSTPLDAEKRLAAEAAVQLVADGMTVGLGTGSTAEHAVRALGRLAADGLAIRAIATSEATRRLATECGLALTDLNETPHVDLTIDGTDRFDDHLNLIKGGGGALLREKIVAAASDRFVIIADSSKRANPLGGFPVPVEVVRFGLQPILNRFAEQGWNPSLRRAAGSGEPFVTDEGHLILDLALATVDATASLAAELDCVPGVVAHGLFLNLADVVLMGRGESVVEFRRS